MTKRMTKRVTKRARRSTSDSPGLQSLQLVRAGELGVVPADDALDLEDDAESLVGLRLEEGKRSIADRRGAVVLEAYRFADREDVIERLHDASAADELDPAQFVVGIATLDQSGHLRITAQVEDHLALAERPERDVAVDDLVPHRDDMGVARRPDGCDVEHLLLGEIGLDLLGCHRDLGPLAGHQRTLTR